ncbi:MAG TPA: TlpA family protein disulfide reductase [Chloroflexi bacterium]|nr:TlpA family protein disulfide reductase [Chloroflexota bacterium]
MTSETLNPQSDPTSSPPRLSPPEIAIAVVGVSALVALIMVIALVMRGSSGPDSLGIISTGQQANVKLRPAPDFNLTSFDDQRLQLSDFRGRVVILNFWASWCPPCRIEAPVLQRAADRLEERGVTVLGIDVWDDPSSATQFLNEVGVTYLNAEDTTREIPVEYGVTGLPETFIINTRGVLVARWIGPITDEQLDQLVSAHIHASAT